MVISISSVSLLVIIVTFKHFPFLHWSNCVNINPIYPLALQQCQCSMDKGSPFSCIVAAFRQPGQSNVNMVDISPLEPPSHQTAEALLHNILFHNNTHCSLFPSSIFNSVSVSSDVRAAPDVDIFIV